MNYGSSQLAHWSTIKEVWRHQLWRCQDQASNSVISAVTIGPFPKDGNNNRFLQREGLIGLPDIEAPLHHLWIKLMRVHQSSVFCDILELECSYASPSPECPLGDAAVSQIVFLTPYAFLPLARVKRKSLREYPILVAYSVSDARWDY